MTIRHLNSRPKKLQIEFHKPLGFTLDCGALEGAVAQGIIIGIQGVGGAISIGSLVMVIDGLKMPRSYFNTATKVVWVDCTVVALLIIF
jgi:hypothetical protein